MRPPDLLRDTGNMVTLTQDFSPPDFKEWRFYVEEMVATVHIAVWGTILSVVAAVTFGLLSSENVAPVWVRQPVRRLMDAHRAINEIVFAMLLVVAVRSDERRVGNGGVMRGRSRGWRYHYKKK